MGAALVANYCMNLIEDQRARRLQHATSAFARQQDVKRFRE